MAAQSMVVASADIESVRRELHADAPRPPPARPGPPPPPPKAPRALSTTMQQASRPTIPEARVEEAPPPNIGSAHTIDLRRTLPQGVGDPRVSQPTPPPAPETTVDPSSSPTTVSAAREDLEFPSLPFGAPTTNPVPYGAKYPPSEAMPSGETTRRAPEPEMSETPAEEKKE